MSLTALLLGATPALPLAMLAVLMLSRRPARLLPLLGLAPLPGLLAALLASQGELVRTPLFQMAFTLTRPGAVLLGGAALLWSAAGFYAARYLRDDAQGGRFCAWWLLTLSGSLGVFIAADLAGFYLLFTMVSLAAYGLIIHEGTDAARRAGSVYLVLALAGEVCLLLALVMLAGTVPPGNPLIADAVAALPNATLRTPILALLLLGFALKMGLMPMHVWLPLAHPAAPMPASAVLSGVVVKAGVIGLLHFMPWGQTLSALGTICVVTGLVTAYGAVLIGLTQARPKTILAYSTVSQMGLMAAIVGAGLRSGDAGASGIAALYALHHVLVKGALFLGVGIVAATGRATLKPVLLIMGLLALSIAGLPLTGGFIAKFAMKPLFYGGTADLLVKLSSVGSALLMLHFLVRLAGTSAPQHSAAAPHGLVLPWAVVALASVLGPWLLFAGTLGPSPLLALAPKPLWDALWPLVLAGALAWLLRHLPPHLPKIPEGDVVVLAEAAGPLVPAFGSIASRVETALRRWDIAGILLLAIVLALAATATLVP